MKLHIYLAEVREEKFKRFKELAGMKTDYSAAISLIDMGLKDFEHARRKLETRNTEDSESGTATTPQLPFFAAERKPEAVRVPWQRNPRAGG